MKRILKVSGIAVLVLAVALAVCLVVVYVYNRIKMKREEPLLEKPLGQMVEVDGHKMCVYEEGEGEHTLLFLSGSGTAAPILDFKSLYSLLKDDYHIVVIEKFGYGFSDVVDEERSFETILRQDREALEKAGISGPFVLCPHSMSGLEAIMWAQEHPDEVEAVIGLDMVLPRTYDNFDFDRVYKYEKLAAFARKLGLVRFFYSDSSLPSGLSKEEKELYRAIACRKAVNVDIINEGFSITDAVKEIDGKSKPDVPMLMFVSDGKEVQGSDWIQNHYDYVSDMTDGKVIELDCGHYVHNFKQDRIAEEIKEFIGKRRNSDSEGSVVSQDAGPSDSLPSRNDFENLDKDLSVEEIIERFGDCGYEGSGIIYHVWTLDDGSKAKLVFNSKGIIEFIYIVTDDSSERIYDRE